MRPRCAPGQLFSGQVSCISQLVKPSRCGEEKSLGLHEGQRSAGCFFMPSLPSCLISTPRSVGSCCHVHSCYFLLCIALATVLFTQASFPHLRILIVCTYSGRLILLNCSQPGGSQSRCVLDMTADLSNDFSCYLIHGTHVLCQFCAAQDGENDLEPRREFLTVFLRRAHLLTMHRRVGPGGRLCNSKPQTITSPAKPKRSHSEIAESALNHQELGSWNQLFRK